MKNLKVKIAAVAASVLAFGSASAAVPIEVTTMFTDLGTDVGTVIGLGYGLLVLAFGGIWTMGFVKKVGRNAK